jgi:hypothetical protein
MIPQRDGRFFDIRVFFCLGHDGLIIFTEFAAFSSIP